MAKFPPLPEPFDHAYEWDSMLGRVRKLDYRQHNGRKADRCITIFTADQLRARDLEIWRMAMEAAATECASRAVRMATDLQERGARECEHAIRALPEPSHD